MQACRHCGAKLTIPFLAPGNAPFPNAYLSKDQLSSPLTFYPLCAASSRKRNELGQFFLQAPYNRNQFHYDSSMHSSRKIVFTNGCFDILHRGHYELLAFCKTMGKVTVGLNSDESIRRLKGPSRPINCEADRVFALESCRYVDEIIVFDEDNPIKLITELKPDVIVKGGDYKIEDVIGSDLAQVVLFPFITGNSTTNLISKMGLEL